MVRLVRLWPDHFSSASTSPILKGITIAKWPDHLKFTIEWPAHVSVSEEPLEMEGGEPQETKGSW